MSDALTASLGRLASLVDGLVASPVAQQLEQLHSACASAVAAAGPAPGAAQQKALWGAAAELWVSLNEFCSSLAPDYCLGSHGKL